jgi:hypothetical protein
VTRTLFLRTAAALVAAAFMTAVTVSAAVKKANVKLVNKSDWTITELYMSPTDDNDWGPDQLGKHVIKPGESYTLSQIPCDTWDIKLVDEDDDECIVEEVDVCANSQTWTIDSKSLLKCQGL